MERRKLITVFIIDMCMVFIMFVNIFLYPHFSLAYIISECNNKM